MAATAGVAVVAAAVASLLLLLVLLLLLSLLLLLLVLLLLPMVPLLFCSQGNYTAEATFYGTSAPDDVVGCLLFDFTFLQADPEKLV